MINKKIIERAIGLGYFFIWENLGINVIELLDFFNLNKINPHDKIIRE